MNQILKAKWEGIKEICIVWMIMIVIIIRMGYMPLLVTLIWKMCRISWNNISIIIFIIILGLGFISGPIIWDAIGHYRDALKYQKRNSCSLKEAWWATRIDYYDYDFEI